MQELFRNIQRLVIPITFKCNFSCRYCYVYKEKRQEFATETLGKIYDLYLKNNENPDRAIYFFGGEPLLRYDLLQWSVAEIKKLKEQYQKKIFLAVTTNGYLLDEANLDFLVKEFNLVGVSIDDLNPQQTFRDAKSINRKLPLLAKYKENILIKMTIMPDFADSFFNTYEILTRLGFKNINISPVLGFYWTAERSEVFLKNIERVLIKARILKKFGFALQLKMVEDIRYIINTKKEYCPVVREELAIDQLGDIYPCQLFVSLPANLRQQYVIGNISSEEVNQDIIKRAEDFKICDNTLIGTEIKKCDNCVIDRSCKKICYGFNILKNNFDAEILANAWQLENKFINLVSKYLE